MSADNNASKMQLVIVEYNKRKKNKMYHKMKQQMRESCKILDHARMKNYGRLPTQGACMLLFNCSLSMCDRIIEAYSDHCGAKVNLRTKVLSILHIILCKSYHIQVYEIKKLMTASHQGYDKLHTMIQKVKKVNALMIDNIRPELVIIETLNALKEKDLRKICGCVGKLIDMLLSLKTKYDGIQLNDYGTHRMAKLYLFTGGVLRNRDFVDDALSILKRKYDPIPDILLFETMHGLSTVSLISGFLRESNVTNSVPWNILTQMIEPLIFRYFQCELPFVGEMNTIYMDIAEIVGKTDKHNFRALAYLHVH